MLLFSERDVHVVDVEGRMACDQLIHGAHHDIEMSLPGNLNSIMHFATTSNFFFLILMVQFSNTWDLVRLHWQLVVCLYSSN